MEIFSQAIKRILNSKIKLLILIIMPIIFIMMFAMQNQTEFTLGVVDKDNSTLSKKLVSSLKGINNIKVMNLTEEEVFDKAVSYQTEYSIIIEEGFEQEILDGRTPEVKEFYINEKDKLFYARAFIENYINDMKLLASGTGYNKERFQAALKEYDKGKLKLTNEGSTGKNASQSRLAMGFLVQFMIYMSVITAILILEDKNSGVFYRVFSAPVSIKKYLFGNLAAFFSVGAAQAVIILALVNVLLGLSLGVHALNMYILFIIFALVCISLGVLIVSIVKKPIFVYSIVLVIATPLLMLGSCYWPKEMMPDTVNKVAQLLPTTWVMSAVDKLLYEGKGMRDILIEIFILLIFAGIFMAGGLFKKIDVSK